jgi:hypothetical protein
MSAQDNLLPCPHCGGSDFDGPHLSEYVGDRYWPTWWIECKGCPCGMEVISDDKSTLVDAWNRRAPIQTKGDT